MIKDIFYELIKEACNGNVIIDGEEWPIGFDTIIEDEDISYKGKNNLSCLIIKNISEFIKLLEDYINVELLFQRKIPKFLNNIEYNTIKWIVTYLFVNASTEDFINPCSYIRKKISFLEDHTFDYLDNGIVVNIGDHFLNSKLYIKKNNYSVAMETPYKIDVSLVSDFRGEKVEYSLPTISYGIEEKDGKKICYIYSLIKPKKKNESSDISKLYEKKISREMYKLNDGINRYELSEYFEYKNGNSSYYPEGNITDVTPSFVLSLEVFISLLQKEGISDIRVVPYLPVRFLSREIAANKVNDDNRRNELRKRNEEIQNNITNKFIRTFIRLAFHNSDMMIVASPYEMSEFLEVRLDKKNSILNNPILEDVSNGVNNLSITNSKIK